jgi:hypothetical protein
VIELGDYAPPSALPPMRMPGGHTLGRLITTEEQRADAIDWIVAQLVDHDKKERAGRAEIRWANVAPTILEVTCVVEHLGGRKVLVPDEIVEWTLGGEQIVHSEAARLARLVEEVGEIHGLSQL